MSTYRAIVIAPILQPHPNADRLSVVPVGGFSVVAATADWPSGRLAAYIPVDMLVDTNLPEFAFLGPANPVHIKAKRLRGIFSEGLLVPARDGWVEGQDVTEEMGLLRYIAPEEAEDGAAAPAPPCSAPKYTDIEQIKNWISVFHEGEEVVITEKINGQSLRALTYGGAVYLGSRTRWVKPDPQSSWGKALESCGLRAVLDRLGEGTVVYGEVYGAVKIKNFKYGLGPERVGFAAFDIFRAGAYTDYDTFTDLCASSGLTPVPLLWRGPFSMAKLSKLAEADSSLAPASSMREGVVVRPLRERYDDALGRVILKLISQRYRLS